MAHTTEHLILATARNHFVAHGYAGARMQKIADEAGINKAMLHYYFRSKEKLFIRIIADILDTILPRISSALGEGSDLWDKIERMVDTYFHILRDEPDIPFFLLFELGQKRERFITALKSRAVYFPPIHAFIGDLKSGMDGGEIRHYQPLHVFLNLLGMIVFPFIARPVFTTIFDMPDKAFDSMMAQRKKIVLDFMTNALAVSPDIQNHTKTRSL